jgi:hypothetical protein
MSVLREIADALADALDAYVFDTYAAPTVERVNWPTYDIESMATPVISVVPATASIERIDRTRHQFDYQINLFLGRHATTEAMADDMVDLAEELVDAVRAHTWSAGIVFPSGVTSPVEVAIDINPDEALQERNVWRAVVTSTYRVFR